MYKIWSMWKITRSSKNARFINIYNKRIIRSNNKT